MSSQPMTAPLGKRLHCVPSNLEDACQTMEEASSEIGTLKARVAELEVALQQIRSCQLVGFSLHGNETWQQMSDLIGKFNSELQKRVKIADAALQRKAGS